MPSSAPERRSSYRIVRVGGRPVGVRVWPGTGRPLVLLHGFLDSSAGWDRLCRYTDRPCFAVDLPGFGRSALPAAPALDLYAERVAGAVAQLVDQPPLWVGHSMGGAVARRVADGPQRELVGALALITPAGFGPLPLAEWADGPLTRKALQLVFPAVTINPLSTILAYPSQVSGGRPAEGAMVVRTMRSALRGPQGPSWGVQALARMSRLPEYELLSTSPYTGPVRSLWGTRDRLIPSAHALHVLEVFPQARITVWEDLAHHPQVEQPRRLQQWIAHSVRQLADPAPA